MRRLLDGLLALTGLAGVLCLLALFVGAAVYRADPAGEAETEEAVYLALPFPEDGYREETAQGRGYSCLVMTYLYTLTDGRQVQAVTAESPLYLEALQGSGLSPARSAVLAGQNAVLYTGEPGAALASTRGDSAFLLLLAEDDGTTLLNLGDQARLLPLEAPENPG